MLTKKINTWLLLLISLFLTYLVVWISSWLTRQGLNGWYQSLQKPSFNPPAIVFQIVWPILYTLMAIAFWKALTSVQGSVKWIILAYSTQLFLNLLWSFLFFTLHSPLIAFIDLLLLVGAIIWMILVFYPISAWSASLLLPYLLWVLFAGVLNFSIWIKNI